MASVSDISAVKTKIRAVVNKKIAGMTRGLKTAGMLILRDSQKIVPVDYGPLKASGFVRAKGANTKNVDVTVGYTAAYAVYVHEDLEKAHGSAFNIKYAAQLARAKELRKKKEGGTTGPFRHNRGENQQAKFLEKPFRDRKADVLAIVKAEMAV